MTGSLAARKPTVLYLIPTLELGGTEQHVAWLASFLKSSGFFVLVVCLYREGVLARDLRNSGVQVVCLGMRSLYDPAGPARLLRLMRRCKVQIVHSYLFGMDLIGVLPAVLARVPAILLTRRETALWMGARHRLMRNAANHLASAVICNSESVKRFTMAEEGLDSGTLRVIRNGIDTDRFAPDPGARRRARAELDLSNDTLLVGAVSNFGVEKGYPVFIEAARRLESARQSMVFAAIGDGPLRPAMESSVLRSGLFGRFRFLGTRTDVAALLNGLDVFVCPSTREGMPNALLEAMATSRAVAASAVGGVPEAVCHRENGLLVPPGDPGSLADAIVALAREPSLRGRLGERARATVREEWSLPRARMAYRALYDRILRSHVEGHGEAPGPRGRT